jgi:transcriptional regulator with XRE-family HTH domain
VDIKRVVGRNIRVARKAQALRQLVPAGRSELSTDFIGKVERGTSLSIESLKAVATAMNVSLSELFAGELQEDARQEALIEPIGLCGGRMREDIGLPVKIAPCFSNGNKTGGNKTGHGDPRAGSVRATPQDGLSQALASAPRRRRLHARPAFMGRTSMTARHARRTPCEGERRQPCRLRCPKRAGVGSVWTSPSGDHGAAGPRDNRVTPRAQPARPAEPPARMDSRRTMRLEAAEERVRP